MVKWFFSLFNRDFGGLHEAAFLLGVSAIFSQILALFRDRLFASTFGTGTTLDIYYASFRIPDLIYVIIASLVAATVLIPFLIDRFASHSHEDVRHFLNSVLTMFLGLLLGASLLAFILLPYVADTLVPGFSEKELSSFILLSRILLIQPIFLGLSNLLGAVTQAFRRFFLYALAPILYNVGIIIGILFFYEPFGIAGLGYGVILGAFLHLIVQIPFVADRNLIPIPTSRPNMGDIKNVFMLSLPRTVTLSANNVIVIILTALASLLGSGSIAVFNLSYNLQAVPLAVIGMSYSVAAFPTLVKLFAEGNKEHFVRYIVVAAKHIIFWSLPALSLFIVLRAQIVRVILGAGAFTWTDTRLTAASLALFSFSVVAQGLILLFVRGYYAAGNTKKPLMANLSASIVTILLAFVFLRWFERFPAFTNFFEVLFRVSDVAGTKILMLPLAFSLGSLLNMTILWQFFKRDFKEHYISVRKSVFTALAGALIIGTVSFYLLRFFDDFFNINTFTGIFMQGFLSGIGGIISGMVFFEFIKDKEYMVFKKIFVDKFFTRKKSLY